MKADIIDSLFRQYYNEALLYALSLSGNRETAEDIVSTAFYKALESADDSIKEFRPWLYAVIRNEYFMLLRKEKKLTDEEIGEEITDGSPEVAEVMIRNDTYRELYRAIGALPLAQKEVIQLFYFSGLPVEKIGQITGKSTANIKVILFRAREALKKRLEESDEF